MKKHMYLRPFAEVVKLNVCSSIAEDNIPVGSKTVWSDELEAPEMDFNDDNVRSRDHLQDHIDNKIDDYRNGSWRSL